MKILKILQYKLKIITSNITTYLKEIVNHRICSGIEYGERNLVFIQAFLKGIFKGIFTPTLSQHSVD